MTKPADKIVNTINSLIAKANSSAVTPEESASFMAKAVELVEKYNLSMSSLGQEDRDDSCIERVAKCSHYRHDQDIIRYVGYLNFVLAYIVHKREIAIRPKKTNKAVKVEVTRMVPYYRICGRQVNVESTIAMAEYLIQAVNRMVENKYTEGGTSPRGKFGADAYDYRRGIINNICIRLYNKRMESNNNAAAHREAGQNASSSTAVALLEHTEHEERRNYDFAFGAGSYDAMMQRASEAEQLAADKLAEIEKIKESDPKNYAKMLKAYNKEHGNKRTIKIGNMEAYKAGMDDGDGISIDPQITNNKATMIGN